MAVKTEIKLTNTNADVLYVDPQNVNTYKKKIGTDLDNIIADLNKIEKTFKTFKADKSTKGSWDTLAQTCIKKSNTYEKKLKADKAALGDTITDAILQYVILGQNTDKAASTAESIDVG